MGQEGILNCEEWIKTKGKRKIQSFQDSFADLFNISLGMMSLDGKALTVWSNSSLICHYISSNNQERCKREKKSIIDYVLKKGQTIKYTCYMGITYFACPIFCDNSMVAIYLGGGICLEENRSLVSNKLIENIPLLNDAKLDDYIKLLENVFNLLNVNENKKIKNENKKEEIKKEVLLLKNKLTLREIEIVNKINTGLSNKEISQELNISEKTVKTHVTSILRKLNMKDRLQIIIFCKNNFMN